MAWGDGYWKKYRATPYYGWEEFKDGRSKESSKGNAIAAIEIDRIRRETNSGLRQGTGEVEIAGGATVKPKSSRKI